MNYRRFISIDDFGLTSGVNHAIIECGNLGVLTSATIMANAQAFLQAAELAKNHPSLRIGCHIVLVDGKPVSRDIPTLTNGTDHFRTGLKDFARAAWRRTIAAEEVQREAEAQIRKLQACGITVTHVDSYKHAHMFPHILRAVLKAAKACGIRAVRNPS
jgi:chitin disaccharide deacetylase